MKKLYSAFVTDKETGEKLVITREYNNMAAFKSDLHGNGYAIAFVCLDENYDEAAEKYRERLEMKKAVRKYVREHDEERAAAKGMTYREYKARERRLMAI